MIVLWWFKTELMQEPRVHGHGPDDVDDAENDWAVYGTSGDPEAVDTADN